MKNLTAEQLTAKHAARVSASVQDIRNGVNAVTQSPMAKAAANLDQAGINYMAAIQSGHTKRRLEAVSLEEWKTKTASKADRVPTGVNAAKDKMTKVFADNIAANRTIQNDLANMPSRTFEERISRMTHQVTAMRDIYASK